MRLSTGGLVAQHIALDHPDLVEGLVLVVSDAYLSQRGRDICLRWRELAQRQQAAHRTRPAQTYGKRLQEDVLKFLAAS